MYVDPIVEEIHQIRAKIFAECNNDLEQLMDRYKAAEAEHKDRLVTLEEVRARAEKRKTAELHQNN